MDESIQFLPDERCARLAVAGALSPDAVVEIVTRAMEATLARGLPTLLVDLTAAALTRRMSMVVYNYAGSRFARCGVKLGRIAFVARAECARKIGFLCTVATNRGLSAASFNDESVALAWLRAAAASG
jgi:hypothetical protein